MAHLDPVDWALREAQLLKGLREQMSDPAARPSLSEPLAVDEIEPSGREPNEPIMAQVISAPSRPADADDATAGDAVGLTADASDLPAEAAIEEARLEGPLAAEEPKSALLMALIEPTIHTAPIDRERAIALRWALRDIKGNRLKMSPISRNDLQTLVELGLVESFRDEPMLTSAGLAAAT